MESAGSPSESESVSGGDSDEGEGQRNDRREGYERSEGSAEEEEEGGCEGLLEARSSFCGQILLDGQKSVPLSSDEGPILRELDESDSSEEEHTARHDDSTCNAPSTDDSVSGSHTVQGSGVDEAEEKDVVQLIAELIGSTSPTSSHGPILEEPDQIQLDDYASNVVEAVSTPARTTTPATAAITTSGESHMSCFETKLKPMSDFCLSMPHLVCRSWVVAGEGEESFAGA